MPGNVDIGCKTPSCGAVGVRRGLCMPCYQKRYKQVRAGKTTWAELERRGRAEAIKSCSFNRTGL